MISKLRSQGSNLVAAGILLSRLAGLIREVVLGLALGNTPVTSAFRFAMRIPNVLQNLLGEGALSASFIPVYARLVEDGEDGQADRLAGTVVSLLIGATAVLVAIGVLAARPIVWVFTDFEANPELFELAVTLLRITTLGLGFLVISAWCLGILNSHRSFFLPYVAPVVWTGAQIVTLVAAMTFDWSLNASAIAVAWAVLAGGILQFVIQVPKVLQLAPNLKLSLTRTDEVRDVLRRFVPAVSSRGVVQLSSFIDTFLALLLVGSALATYGFALPLYLMPISLFGFSVAASELAEMSRESGEEAVVSARVRPALRRVLVPAGFITAAYLTAGRTIVDALYGFPGRVFDKGFDDADVTAVWLVLLAFASGLPAAMTARITQNTLYSVGEVRGPARIAVVRLTVAVVLSAFLMFQLDWILVAGRSTFATLGDVPHWPPWERLPTHIRQAQNPPPHLGIVGLALGSSAASWVEWVLLRRMLRQRLNTPVKSGWFVPVSFAALAAGVVMLPLNFAPIPSPIDTVVINGLGAGVFAGTLWLQGIRSLGSTSEPATGD